MKSIRTAPAVVGLLLVPTTVLLGTFTPAHADATPAEVCATASPAPADCTTPTPDPTPSEEPTPTPTPDPTADPSISDPPSVVVDDCSMYGEGAFATDDGHCAILGPPPVAPTETDNFGPTHQDPPPVDQGHGDVTTDPSTPEPGVAAPTDGPTTDPGLTLIDQTIEPLTAHSGDAPNAGHGRGTHGGTLAVAGLGLGLALAGGVMIRLRARKD